MAVTLREAIHTVVRSPAMLDERRRPALGATEATVTAVPSDWNDFQQHLFHVLAVICYAPKGSTPSRSPDRRAKFRDMIRCILYLRIPVPL
jgi:hypothetical protein